MRRLLGVSVVAAAAIASVAAQGPAPLPMGSPAAGKVGDAPAEYTLAAKTAGVLTVAVQGAGDLALQVVDEDGQPILDGSSDRDLNGNDGTELLSATITEPGTYRVRVRVQGGNGSTFQIVGMFMSFPPFQRTSDPDRRPAGAKPAQVGRAYEETLDPSTGDHWDWFVIKAAQAGTLTVVTRQSGAGDAPDLRLEIYTDGDFSAVQDRSDQDLQNNTANESVSVQVAAGQAVHVKVASNSSRPAKYRLSSSLAP